MHILHRTQKAFTLLEVVMVMVILGIVASISSSAIVNVYGSYISQRAVHDASLKTELAINQLANRLAYRMDRTLLARRPGNTGTVAGTDFFPARSVPVAQRDTFNALEWISYDNDTFDATQTPGWSGYIDIVASLPDGNPFSPGATASTQLSHYGNWQRTGMRFMTANYAGAAIPFTYDETCLYSDFMANGCMLRAVPSGNRILLFPGGIRSAPPAGLAGNLIYSEFYQIARSAFAVVPTAKAAPDNTINGIPVFDLVLHWGYQPWWGDNYTDGTRSTLIENVSVFRFKKETNAIRIKICSIEQIGENDQISICKEKAVIR